MRLFQLSAILQLFFLFFNFDHDNLIRCCSCCDIACPLPPSLKDGKSAPEGEEVDYFCQTEETEASAESNQATKRS